MNHPQGSVFRKWDLHVHTPESIVRGSFSGPDAWEKWLLDIEALPAEFAVIGINDYLFLDGYKRALHEKEHNNRLQNIRLLIPVVELRLAMFSGSGAHLNRINLHVLFSETLAPEVIEQQFLNRLYGAYRLDTGNDDVTWGGAVTRESLSDLGNAIKARAPEPKRTMITGGLQTGFDNLTVELSKVEKLFESTYLRDRSLLALGKTEWDQIRWDQAGADKKHLASTAAFLFSACENIEAYTRARSSLTVNNVNNRLLDCSDAHHYRDSQSKDRIGNCFTWVKADTTFEGLRMAMREFDQRVYIGEKPPIALRVSRNLTRTIANISVNKIENSSLSETWFNTDLDLNPGLVAIIGNKGSGKSALADIIGLLGDTRTSPYFSFLSKEKFCQPRSNKAEHFVATLRWESGGNGPVKKLSEKISDSAIEQVRYLPQRFLEHVCSGIDSRATKDFYGYLEDVIYSHVLEKNRHGRSTLAELIAFHTELTQKRLDQLRQDLKEINRKLGIAQEAYWPKHREELSRLLADRRSELRALTAVRPSNLPQPADDQETNGQLQSLRQQIDQWTADREQLQQNRQTVSQNLVAVARRRAAIVRAKQRLENFRLQYQEFVNSWNEDSDLAAFPIPLTQLVAVSINATLLDGLSETAEAEDNELTSQLDDPQTGIEVQLSKLETNISNASDSLSTPQREFQIREQEIADWESQRRSLIGDPSQVESIRGIAKRLRHYCFLPTEINLLHERQQEKILEIYREIGKLADHYRDLYSPVESFITNHSIGKTQQLGFEVAIVQEQFHDRFFGIVSHGITGSFCGADEGRTVLSDILDRAEFSTEDGIIAFLHDIDDHLQRDHRVNQGLRPTLVTEQLRKGRSLAELYDFIYGLDYLIPRYVLRWSGKEIDQLSPGEKGTLLLVFYLLIDKSQIPLVIDQPEDNLDNETVYKQLVPAIRKAKQDRQIILVTHNPNLAVVCDADQVIAATRDKSAAQTITYTSGALESPVINKSSIDVLEGTRDAFNIRDTKYFLKV